MKHGRTGYTYHRCRCDICTAANSAYQREWMLKAVEQEPPVHGRNGYTNYSCRCDICSAAWRAYKDGLRQRRKTDPETGPR